MSLSVQVLLRAEDQGTAVRERTVEVQGADQPENGDVPERAPSGMKYIQKRFSVGIENKRYDEIRWRRRGECPRCGRRGSWDGRIRKETGLGMRCALGHRWVEKK